MSMTRRVLSIALLAAAAGAQAADSGAQPAERPGYGIVESVKSLSPEQSSSAGASAPGPARASYLVRVRMSDGSIQIRNQKRRDFKAGDRVLLTNAGDIVKDW